MKFVIEPAVLEKYPHLKVGVLVVKGMDNTQNEASTFEFLQKTSNQAQKKYEGKALNQVPKIVDWRQAYHAFGYKSSSFRSSVEALLRRVMKGDKVPNINAVVNLSNLISIKHTLPVGGYDLDQVSGPIRLTIAKGGEPFVKLGSREKEQAKVGEIIYSDEQEVLTKIWNWRESDTSKITQKSQNTLLVIEGLEHTSPEEIAQALDELGGLIEKECGGQGETYLLDKEIFELGDNALLSKRSFCSPLSKPDYHKQEPFQVRTKKLEAIRAMGIDPYPHTYRPTHSMAALHDQYTDLAVGTSEEASAHQTNQVCIAGRVRLFRSMGKNAFAQLQDESGQMQVMFNKEQTQVSSLPKQEQPLRFIEKKIDLGDIIGIEGFLFRTQKGELTILVTQMTLLCKALLPLPDKHSGLTDKESRYRKRWLDLITNKESAEKLRLRSLLMSKTRRFFEEAGFIEVETPILQNTYGGAEATPFITELEALHQQMYLRISPEISLKKLIVGGMSKIFELGKVFRNEGLDRTHNPEFTILEAYAAYWDYNDAMTHTENLFAHLARELYGTTQIGRRRDKGGNSHLIDLKTPWKRLTMKQAITLYGGFDPDTLSEEEMRKQLATTSIDQKSLKEATRGQLIASLFEEFAEHHLIEPHHIIDHPIETTPLCKLHRDPHCAQEGLVERFETFILGYEFCNAYSELNDPQLQRSLLETQNKKREEGNLEAHPMDEEFIEAICQGMTPAGGLGIGMDRLTMLFTDAFSIRDVLYFPIMRPEE